MNTIIYKLSLCHIIESYDSFFQLLWSDEDCVMMTTIEILMSQMWGVTNWSTCNCDNVYNEVVKSGDNAILSINLLLYFENAEN